MDITLNITTTDDLRKAVEMAIKESGCKKTFIAEKMNISNQNFNRFMSKKHFSIDDANRILSIIGYQAEMTISKKVEK